MAGGKWIIVGRLELLSYDASVFPVVATPLRGLSRPGVGIFFAIIRSPFCLIELGWIGKSRYGVQPIPAHLFCANIYRWRSGLAPRECVKCKSVARPDPALWERQQVDSVLNSLIYWPHIVVGTM